jgi:competence protein ComEC
MFSVSIAAQLGTMPFTLYYFQQFPNYFLLTNIIAIPLSSLVIYLAIGLLMTSFIPYLSLAVAFLLKWSLWLLNFVIVGIEGLPHSVSHISLDIRQTLVLFLAVFCFSAYYFNRKFLSLAVGLASVLIACLFNLQTNYETLTSKRMVVYAGQKGTHISFINRNQNLVISTDSVEAGKIATTFWQNQKLEKAGYRQPSGLLANDFVGFEGKRILILTQDFLSRKISLTPLTLDYLILGNHLKPKINQLLECVHPRKIIVDKSISTWYANSIRDACLKQKIGFYSVAEQGAYVLNIKD